MFRPEIQAPAPEQILESAGHLRARYVLDREDSIGEAFADVVFGDRRDWTPREVRQRIREINGTDLTVAEWLEKHRGKDESEKRRAEPGPAGSV